VDYSHAGRAADDFNIFDRPIVIGIGAHARETLFALRHVSPVIPVPIAANVACPGSTFKQCLLAGHGRIAMDLVTVRLTPSWRDTPDNDEHYVCAIAL
jgi:hypothetical protein